MEQDGSSEEELLAFLYACPTGLIQCDAAGAIDIMNPFAMQHLLMLAGDGDTTNLFEALGPYAPELRSIVEEAPPTVGYRICEGHRINVGLARAGAAGSAKVLSTTIVRIGQNRLMVTLADATVEVERERRLAEAEATNLAKSRFLANMSHEIRTPLNGVLGMAQALALDTLTPGQHEKVQTIRDAGRSLLVLLNDILDLSKIEAGQLELDLQPFDLEQMIKSTYAIFVETAKAKGLPVVFTARGEVAGLWVGDAHRCRQIVSNLLDNAIKFTSTGEVRVELERVDDSAVRLRVCDTGAGISEADLSKLFAKFCQVDTSSTRRFGGAGLGLSICQELTKMMGGSISVASRPGEGSTFTVDLPLRRLDADRAPVSAAHPAPSLQPPGLYGEPVAPEAAATLRVLAAEDNPTNQLILKTLLQVFDIDVVVVDNGRLAVEAWEAGGFDLILMDIQMPDMDGLAATRRIRAFEKELGRARTPILAVTANVMTHQVEEYQRAGMDGHVAKPIELEALYEALGKA
jgi:signal transduction histidine kinase/CheY-like chemotaxis protein